MRQRLWPNLYLNLKPWVRKLILLGRHPSTQIFEGFPKSWNSLLSKHFSIEPRSLGDLQNKTFYHALKSTYTRFRYMQGKVGVLFLFLYFWNGLENLTTIWNQIMLFMSTFLSTNSNISECNLISPKISFCKNNFIIFLWLPVFTWKVERAVCHAIFFSDISHFAYRQLLDFLVLMMIHQREIHSLLQSHRKEFSFLMNMSIFCRPITWK